MPTALLIEENVECNPITYKDLINCVIDYQYSINILNNNLKKIKEYNNE